MTNPRACDKWIEAISAYADGECGAAERLRVWWHLRTCRACREWLAAIRRDGAAFTEALLQPTRGADITADVMQEVSAMSKQHAVRPARKGSRLVEVMAVLGILAVLSAVLFPVFARAREKARQTSCLSNMKQLALGVNMFAQDYEGRLPGAVTWQDDIAPYIKNEAAFTCPTRPVGSKGGYAINPHVAGRKIADIADPETTVLLYEVGPSGQPVFPHNGGANYAYVDGHCKWMSKRDHPADLQASGFVPPERNYGIADRLRIAYQATVEVVVENVYQSVLQAEAAAVKCGGFLMESDLSYCGRRGRASLIVRVPTEQVGTCVNALGALGFVANRHISGEDLTRRHVTTTREIGDRTERAGRLSEMVETMGEDLSRVQAEQNLGTVETEATGLRDTIFDIDTRVTLATISATLTEKEPTRGRVLPDVRGSFGSALSSLWTLTLRLGSVLAWVLVYAPVWALVLAAGLLGYRRLHRGGE